MKVPDDLVEAAIENAWPGWIEENPASAEVLEDHVGKALEAVLPKVRERLTEGDVVDVVCRKISHVPRWKAHQSLEAAFDHAFPEEGSGRPVPDPPPTPSKDENAA